MNVKHVVLVGMPGCGKSTLGAKLAKLVNLPFVDTDAYIVEKTGKSIADIFDVDGEERFREIERQLLVEILDGEPAVVATGGGMPCFFDNMALMNARAITVYLEMNPGHLYLYLSSDKRRPLMQGKTPRELIEYIDTTLENRKRFYETAHARVDPRAGSPSKIVAGIMEAISNLHR